MSDESKVRELFAPLQEQPIDTEGRRFKVDREKIVATILNAPSAVSTARAARSRRISMLAMAAGIALVAGAAGWWATMRQAPVSAVASALRISDVRGQVTRVRGATEVSVVPGERATVPPDGELVTQAHSEVSVETARGLEVRLFENSRIRLSDLDVAHAANAVHLDAGSIRCRVPHLAEGEQFSVITPDATVVVHGTIFRVEVGRRAEGGSNTCVRVEEGVVSVHGTIGEARLTGSQSWGCEATADLAAAPPPPAPDTSSKPRPAPRVAAQSKDTSKEAVKVEPSTLTEENRLFQAGLAAESKGDARAAIAAFQLLLSRYPQSPLAADALSALARAERNSKRAP